MDSNIQVKLGKVLNIQQNKNKIVFILDNATVELVVLSNNILREKFILEKHFYVV